MAVLPIDPLTEISNLVQLLKDASLDDVECEVLRVEALIDKDQSPERDKRKAALSYARGAMWLRQGAVESAQKEFALATSAFEALNENEASMLSHCEALLATMRSGVGAVAYTRFIEELEGLANTSSERVWVVATHYRGTAQRLLGDAAGAQQSLLVALEKSEPFLDERAKILNSLGTLYVVLGAFGAAEALLEHAAELHQRLGDAVGESIAAGQLGVVALGLGQLESARQHLLRQEWLSERLGDAFGGARALAFLAELALEQGRPDDAVLLAKRASNVAERVSPSLTTWIAYATRVLGRALHRLGDPAARSTIEKAEGLFATIDNPLGAALTAWDRAHADSLDAGDVQAGAWFPAAWAFGSLALPSRVAQLLRDRRDIQHALKATADAQSDATEQILAAIAQATPHLAVVQEVELVYERTRVLAAIADRRTASQRNLGRLAALTLALPGLLVAVVTSAQAGHDAHALPSARAAAACAARLPGCAIWVWPAATSLEEVGRDLAALRNKLGEDTRAVLRLFTQGRLHCPPFSGDVGAELQDVDVSAMLMEAFALEPGLLRVDPTLAWSGEPEARAAMAGFVTEQSGCEVAPEKNDRDA